MKALVAFLFLAQILFAEQNFSEAKKTLTKFYQDNPQYQTDFYCNAPFKWVKNRFEIVPSEFYTPRKAKLIKEPKGLSGNTLCPRTTLDSICLVGERAVEKNAKMTQPLKKWRGIYKI